MKVLFVHNAFMPYQVGGAEYSLLDRCKGLIASGVEAEVLTISPFLSLVNSIDMDFYESIKVHRIRLPWSKCSPYYKSRSLFSKLFWHLSGLVFFFNGYNKFKRFVIEGGFSHVVFINTPGFPYLFYSGKIDVKKGFVVADYNYICLKGTMYKQSRKCANVCLSCSCSTLVKRRALRGSSFIVYISNHMKNIYEKNGVSSKRSRVVYNGQNFLNKSAYSPVVKNKFTVGFIGQVNLMKGVGLLLDEMLILESELDGSEIGLNVVIAGQVDSKLEGSLTEKYSDLDVEFIGKVDQKEFYKGVDLVVVPSLWDEPLGRVPFESISNGRMVFVSNAGGLKETVPSEEFSFDVNNIGSLSRLIHSYLNLSEVERQCMFQKALFHSTNRFSTMKSIAGYMEVFDEC